MCVDMRIRAARVSCETPRSLAFPDGYHELEESFVPNLVGDISANIELIDLAVALALAVLCALALATVVQRYSRIIGDRTQYTPVFLILIPTMVLIISVVKSSLALSLGLVGALSIVRFRTPIKEPEELTYLFIAIAVGLGLGAGQIVPTLFSFAVVMMIMILVARFRRQDAPQGVFLDVEGKSLVGEVSIKALNDVIAACGLRYELRRYNQADDGLSVTYFLQVASADELDAVIEGMKHNLSDATFTVIDRSRQPA